MSDVLHAIKSTHLLLPTEVAKRPNLELGALFLPVILIEVLE